MNVGPGGKQAVMRPTVWNGSIQTMVLPDGQPKRMKLVLQERGMDTTSMKADAMREKLKTYPDFKNQKTILEEYIERRGHLCLFYPKFHCELSPIERVWCHSKKHTRAYANGSIIRLRQLVPKGLNSVTTEMIIYTLTLLTCLQRALNHAPLVHVHVIISKLYNSGT